MIELPSAFRTAMAEQLGEEAPAFFAALDAPATLALRIDPQKPDSLEAAQPFIAERVPWEPLGYYLKDDTRPGASIEHACGAFYLQEASAMVSVAALAPKPGERILDLCAAPGGKSTQIAAYMKGLGLLVCNEYDSGRAKVLASNLERMGVTNAIAVNARPDALAKRWDSYFDAVLCDAPCSGEGMFRRDIESRLAWDPASPEGCAIRQAEILDSAAAMVRPGGRLVYSTCTFNTKENEDTVAAFLNRHPEFNMESFELEGIDTCKNGVARIYPHRQYGDGHFCARLRKSGNESIPPAPTRRNTSDDTALIRQLEHECCILPDTIDRNFLRMRDYIYAIPNETPNLDGLRIVKPGVCLLRIGRNYIEPAHSLAMILKAGEAIRSIDLSEKDAVRYLAGETLETSSAKGWTQVTFNHLPLGWGKVSGDQLKNHLPKGLRLSLHL